MSDTNSSLSTIKQIISKYLDSSKYKVFLFGSRAKGTSTRYSDYDVGIIGNKPVSPSVRVNIAGDLEDSNLPVKVDVVDFYTAQDKFKRLAMVKTIRL